MDKNIFDITPQPDPRPEGKCCCGDADNLTISWIHIHKIIDEGMEKSDRSVSIYIHPESGINVSVYPLMVYDKE